MRRLDPFLLLFGLLALWQGLHWVFGDLALASPVETGRRIAELFAAHRFWLDSAETGKAFGAALLISSLGGLALGIALGLHRLSADVAGPLLVSLYSLPKVTLYPIILLIFGLGLSAKVAFGALHGLIPVTLFAMNAVLNLRPVLYRTAQTLWLTRWQTVAMVIVPATIPDIVTGLRFGLSASLLGVLIGEMFASKRGLGSAIFNAIQLGDSATIEAITVLIAVLAIGANVLLLRLERRLNFRSRTIAMAR